MRSTEDSMSLDLQKKNGNGNGNGNRNGNGNWNGDGNGNGLSRSGSHRTPLGKPTPSKWDDAQKWVQNKASPRSSNADDRRLIKTKEEVNGSDHCDVETKRVDCDESVWRVNKAVGSYKPVVRSVCVRDMGTEMTPIGSQEPSRTATPIRAMTPVARSPVSSGQSTPVQFGNFREVSGENMKIDCDNDVDGGCLSRINPLESRAVAWDEAERAKYMARYKREQVKIEAWENHQKRKAEMKMKKVEVKAERLKSRAQEKYTNKLAASRRIAEEKRANAEAKLNDKAVKTSRRADYIRRTGHLPSSFSFNFPSLCCYR